MFLPVSTRREATKIEKATSIYNYREPTLKSSLQESLTPDNSKSTYLLTCLQEILRKESTRKKKKSKKNNTKSWEKKKEEEVISSNREVPFRAIDLYLAEVTEDWLHSSQKNTQLSQYLVNIYNWIFPNMFFQIRNLDFENI